MLDIDINKLLKKGRNSKSRIYKKIINWFIRHYFSCDIKCNSKISDTVYFAHNGLGPVINEDCIIESGCVIQHHVTIGRKRLKDKKVPYLHKNVYVGTGAIILGEIEIGENAIIGAGVLVDYNVKSGEKIIFNKRFLDKEDTQNIKDD